MREGIVIDDTWEEISPGKSRNTMKLENLSREDLNTVLECLGNNNNNTQPVITSIAITMMCEFYSITRFAMTSAKINSNTISSK